MKSAQLILVLLGCLHIGVGSLNLMQMVAWTGMMVDYSTGRTLAEAAEMTLDGQHPCEMCLSIAEARRQNNESDSPLPGEDRSHLRMEVLPLVMPTVVSSTRRFPAKAGPRAGELLLQGAEEVPGVVTPPPRSMRGAA